MEKTKEKLTRWDKLNISYVNYQTYLNTKESRHDLSLVDLLYICNFKGGNASIQEGESIVSKKLRSYSEILNRIEKRYIERKLAQLNDEETLLLIEEINKLFHFTERKNDFKIDGLGISLLSALLNSHCPDLIPIIDRNVLLGLGFNDDELKINSSTGQITNTLDLYPKFIKEIQSRLRTNPNKTMRELDKELFSKGVKIRKSKKTKDDQTPVKN